ncbi:TPA: hypothetical protein ACONN5_002642 [Staphylococcus aureus]
MKSIFLKGYTYKKFDNLNNWRKMTDDWGLNIYKFSKYRKLIICLILITILTASTSFNLIFKYFYSVNENQYLSFTHLFLFVLILLGSITFFSKHKNTFLQNESKLINEPINFNFIKVMSEMLYSTLIQFIIYFLLIYAPIFFLNSSFGVFQFLKNVIFLLLLQFFGITICSFIGYVVNKYLFKTSDFTFTKLTKNFLLMILTFSIVYFISSSLIDKTFLINLLDYYENMNIYNVVIYIENSLLHTINYFIFIALLFILDIIMLVLWYTFLQKQSLIVYDEISKKGREYSQQLLNTKHLFFWKDLIHLKRLGGWLLSYFTKTIFATFIISGAAIPIILNFWGNKLEAYVSISIILSIAIYQLVGDSLKMILSIDAEKNNFHFIVKYFNNMWELVKYKWYIYCLFSLWCSLLLSIVAFIFSIQITISITMFIISFTFGNITGLFQISTTGLYPKLNWEHHHEIGQSKKSVLYDEYFSYVLSIIYFFSILILIIPEKIGANISNATSLITIIILFIFLNIIVIFLGKLFLSKKTIKGSFYNE